MDSQLPELPEELPGLTENVVNTNYLTVYATPKFEYRVRHVNLSLNLPVSYARYNFDKAIANHDEVYFSPSLSMNWKPNNRFSGTFADESQSYPSRTHNDRLPHSEKRCG